MIKRNNINNDNDFFIKSKVKDLRVMECLHGSPREFLFRQKAAPLFQWLHPALLHRRPVRERLTFHHAMSIQ